MDLLHPQLSAFAAIIEEGTFEAAARRLAVTPSAVSQRIKALEDRLGQVLVVRQAPCKPTAAGERLLLRLRPMQALEAEAMVDFLPEEARESVSRPIAIAVNDDSLHTWVLTALAALHDRYGYFFDVRVDDQDHTLDHLRQGSVLGAITSERKPLQGCNVYPLGRMRYHAIASPSFARKHFREGMDAESLATAPMIVFNRKDELQWRYVRRVTRAQLAPPIHYLPTSTGFVEAAARGLGWCLATDSLFQPALQAGEVVIVDKHRTLDVPLYWQCAAVRSSTLQRIGASFVEVAGRLLAHST
ncbi:LysR family transcriptional regulator ArgP [Luteibacter aegosomaticola]|uniref:LysR family transcriptional regulator ArgP n=1 Tax=Luteibacter aegosomaticola TaxID=2911538 RepID=UPI001FF8384C|nr:LysR family transcriptional regulator ArgP [Luteibacter aegosomaticola]UPG91042.1 LysR family transcriptional regulator ArgP [Luteibacter aegosomaticola]